MICLNNNLLNQHQQTQLDERLLTSLGPHWKRCTAPTLSFDSFVQNTSKFSNITSSKIVIHILICSTGYSSIRTYK